MKTVLCFGDSNTYGLKPDKTGRYERAERWSGILKERLWTENTEVIEEGLVGRTSVFEDCLRAGRKGSDFLLPLLESHAPVDTLVLMLGTNDCKTLYGASSQVIGLGIEKLICQAKHQFPELDIVLVSPIHLGEKVWLEAYDPEFNQTSVQVSKELKAVYQKIAQRYQCRFLAASDVAEPSELDQEHMDAKGHLALAKLLYAELSGKKGA